MALFLPQNRGRFCSEYPTQADTEVPLEGVMGLQELASMPRVMSSFPKALSGVGFFEKIGVTTRARHPSLAHTLGSPISQSLQEAPEVWPSPCHRRDHHDPNASAPVERPPRHRVSPLECGAWGWRAGVP